MKLPDSIEIVYLDDGRIKVITGPISQPNHVNAELLVKQIQNDMGGEVVIEPRTDAPHRHGGREHTQKDTQNH